jgi:peptidyl-prolyl cis-trans isomerase SurA
MSVPSSMRELCWSLALLSSCSLALAQQVETLDRIVAVINGDVVTSVELERETRIAVETLRRQGTSLPQRDVLERQLLERLVSKQVLLQVARQTGLRVADAEVDAALERIAAENKMKSVADLRVAVEQSGVPFDKFREDLRSEILISRLREREVEGKINVTDAEIQNFLRAQEAQAERVDEYRLAHILVSVPEQATPEQLKLRRDRAETALAQLKQGVDFRQVAAGYSDAPDALQGGDMGWRPAGRLPGIFLTALKGMKIGQDSDILRSPAGFHIVRLTDKRGNDTPVMVVQTHARHILIRLNELVSENEARTRLAELKDRIEHGADFADLARLHSNDASAVRGGDLGWLSPGDTVPEFERAIRPLKPSQVSDPFKSAFGWHIVQVLERREHDMSKDRQRMTARQAIRARKSDEQWAEWVRQQRDKAYVEIKLEEK